MLGGNAVAELSSSTQRRTMVDCQIRTFDVTDLAVIECFSTLARERFLPPDLRQFAYSDAALTLKGRGPGAQDRVLLSPMHLARMIQGARVEASDRVLVVAGETGYGACLIAGMGAKSVVTLEDDEARTAAASVNARDLGLAAVEAVTGSLSAGFVARAPYDLILVQGAAETGLDALFAQMAPGGRLVVIETLAADASRRAGRAMLYRRVGDDVSERALFDATAPLIPDFRRPAAFVF